MRLKLTERSLAGLELPADKPQLIAWDSELSGFGVVVGKTARTFIAEGRIHSRKWRKAIGVAGKPRDDGHTWTVVLARLRAKELLGKGAEGKNPNARKPGSGHTLREALEAHLARMEKKRRAERSISTLRSEIEKYLAPWLDRPIGELTGAALVDLHEQIKQRAKPRLGTNPKNARGAPLANRVIVSVGACWNSLNKKLEGALGNWNPAKAVDRDHLAPSRARISDEDLSAWWAKVQTLTPVRRDLQIFCMWTGMRSEAARHARWEHLDEERFALEVPSPKGGESKAFTLPLGPTVMAMLSTRRTENAATFAPHDGDGGWIFPSLSRDLERVIPMAEAKERRLNEDGERVRYLEGPHTSRRTYLSVAAEIGVSELDRSCLANHTYGARSVNETYVKQAFAHLLAEQTRIDAALRERMKPKRSHLRAVK